MAEILKPHTECMLQVNTSGSWRNVLTFEPAQREQILTGLAGLAIVLGDATRWCLHHADGRREWLHAEDFATGEWKPVTDAEPAPLVDVLVSAYAPDDGIPHTFMAWRGTTPCGHRVWIMSGTAILLPMQVYAYRTVMEPAPMPARVPQA